MLFYLRQSLFNLPCIHNRDSYWFPSTKIAEEYVKVNGYAPEKGIRRHLFLEVNIVFLKITKSEVKLS